VSKIARALLSVSNKAGLVDLGRALAKAGVELLASGGTAKALLHAGVPVREVSDFTGSPEILDGRVKTLHPRIHGGLLGRSTTRHREEMHKAGIPPIDLLVVNLYPFRETVARGAPFEDIIENIDIGGPAMIRSAAKNHERVTVLVDPEDYGVVLTELENHGEVPAQLRFELACKAFAHTAAYDGAIASYLTRLDSPLDAPADFPESQHWSASLQRTLRYGENPHQKAAFYALEDDGVGLSLPRAEVLQGKELSYNNLLDLDAAMRLCAEFAEPAAAIIKHTNPCGCAISPDGVLDAYRHARETDPLSAFGGIVAVNRQVDARLAHDLCETFLECVIAPAYTAEALTLLATKKNLRLLAYDFPAAAAEERAAGARMEVRSVSGGFLVQTRDMHTASAAQAKVVTARAPTDVELGNLDFAWRVAKHVKSNAIVFCDAGHTLGVGAGQMSRVDSVRIAVAKARASLVGSVLASDAFFPFRDGVDEAAKAGVTAIIQPGGSLRDEESIAAANAHGIAMVFTGQRHFKH
jgi:phosphoribosylaminoimidazolecarboxamide formyltransferase/IMP cyclohydrolase